jgi:hypothetical protein
MLLDESHKLDPWSLHESPRPKSGKSRLNLYMAPIWKENQFVQTQKKTAHDLKNQDARIGSNSREGFKLKDSINFK